MNDYMVFIENAIVMLCCSLFIVIHVVNCIFPLEFDEEYCLYVFSYINFFRSLNYYWICYIFT